MLISSLTIACDSAKSGTGVSLSEDGRIVVHVKPCDASELVYEVRLEDYSASTVGIAVWDIVSNAGSDLREFIIGSTPPGFNETTPLTTTTASMTDVTAVVRRSGDNHDGVSFDPKQLSPDKILVDHRSLLPSEFASRDVCNG